jgi:hypothetical protein
VQKRPKLCYGLVVLTLSKYTQYLIRPQKNVLLIILRESNYFKFDQAYAKNITIFLKPNSYIMKYFHCKSNDMNLILYLLIGGTKRSLHVNPRRRPENNRRIVFSWYRFRLNNGPKSSMSTRLESYTHTDIPWDKNKFCIHTVGV